MEESKGRLIKGSGGTQREVNDQPLVIWELKQLESHSFSATIIHSDLGNVWQPSGFCVLFYKLPCWSVWSPSLHGVQWPSVHRSHWQSACVTIRISGRDVALAVAKGFRKLDKMRRWLVINSSRVPLGSQTWEQEEKRVGKGCADLRPFFFFFRDPYLCLNTGNTSLSGYLPLGDRDHQGSKLQWSGSIRTSPITSVPWICHFLLLALITVIRGFL